MNRLFRAGIAVAAALLLLSPSLVVGQTATTGALSGRVTDPTGALLPGVEITLTNLETGQARIVKTGGDGSYRILLLEPGSYGLKAEHPGFKVVTKSDITIIVTETATFDFAMVVGAVADRVEVTSKPALVQAESAEQGRVVGLDQVVGLPLVTRNFTEIVGLSPGVSMPVGNATALGPGGPGSAYGEGEGMYSQGQRSFDNNFQIDGVQVNETITGAAANVPIPSPDTIQEFKVLTGQFDASFGRNAGANVNVITKSGTNAIHGNVYEFFRNRVLNANDFFFNRNDVPKPTLSSNVFGGTLGGPIQKDKLFFFGSYEATRQSNAFAPGCSATTFLPPFTSDRSAAAIGALYAGQYGYFQNLLGEILGIPPVGPSVAADGSNINPVALAFLQAKLPNGNYQIPIPQTVNPNLPLDIQGSSTYTIPCKYNQNQYVGNLDYFLTQKQHLTAHVLGGWSGNNFPFFGNGSSIPTNVPGTTQANEGYYNQAELAHTLTISPSLFNNLQVAWWRSIGRGASTDGLAPWNTYGVTAPPQDNMTPALFVSDMYLGSGGGSTTIASHAILQDTVAWVHGKHSIRFGGGLDRQRYVISNYTLASVSAYLTWADFLLGLSAAQNGTTLGGYIPGYSNVEGTFDFLGEPQRDWRIWAGNAFFQDDIKLTRRLTVNLGLRYERIGQFADALGRNSAFDAALGDPNPPPGGSYAGYIVAGNYNGPPLPAGVTKANNNFATAGLGENRLSPRVGFAWQVLPNSTSFVLRGGWGMYNSQPAGESNISSITGPPYTLLRDCFITCNPGATAANPFPSPTPAPSDFPIFPAYSASTALSTDTTSQRFQPAIVQHYSLGLQTEVTKDLLFEIGYAGARGTRTTEGQEANEAQSASPSNPIRGQTDNTVANVNLRRPLLGWADIVEAMSVGGSRYDALEASLNKRMSHGLQFLASYTWSKAFDTAGAALETAGFGVSNVPGDPSNPRSRWGPSAFNHPQRFVFSTLYPLPSPGNKSSLAGRTLGGWEASGVITIQSGTPITLIGVNANNVFGINGFYDLDHLNYAPGCNASGLQTHGSVSSRVNGYFNTSCIGPWPVISPDGIGTGFGNIPVGVIRGPGQANVDMAIIKKIPITERFNAEFRTEFFNLFNHPQFANPDNDAADSTFGLISYSEVNPRVIQFALKLNF